jgi:hypothetical protein
MERISENFKYIWLVLIVALPSSLALNSDMKPAELQQLTTELDHGIQYVGAKVQENSHLKTRTRKLD